MAEKCVFCDKETVTQIPLRFELKVCTNCYATYMHANRFAGINRDLERFTRLKWLEIVENKSKNWSGNKTPKCMLHDTELKRGSIPDYGYDGWVADCCDYMHIEPELMVQILNVGIEHETSFHNSGKYSNTNSGFVQAITRFLAWPFFWAYTKFFDKGEEEADLFEGMQYNHRFKEYLDPKGEFDS